MNTRTIVMAVVLVAFSCSAHATLLQVNLEGEAFKNSAIGINHEFSGLSGDIVDLPEGQHDITFSTNNMYRFSVRVVVTAEKISVESTANEAPNCEQPLEVNWQEPIIYPPANAGAFATMIVSEPKFGGPKGSMDCMLPSMASCESRKIILKASTTPKSAEIWIDGRLVNQKTDAILSVPFCLYEKTKRVVYRLPGRVNCQRDLSLAPDDVVDASCDLQETSSGAK